MKEAHNFSNQRKQAKCSGYYMQTKVMQLIWTRVICLQKSHSIFNFSQLFNVHGISDVKQTEAHTEDPLCLSPLSLKMK